MLITREEMQKLKRKIEELALMIQSGFEKLNQRMDEQAKEQERRDLQSLGTQSDCDIALKEALKEIAETKKELAAANEQKGAGFAWLLKIFGGK